MLCVLDILQTNTRQAAEVMSVFNVLLYNIRFNFYAKQGLQQYHVEIISPIKPNEWSLHKQTQQTAF